MMPVKTGEAGSVTWRGYDSQTLGRIENLDAVRTDDGVLWSCWSLTWREKLAIVLGSKLWLGVSAERQPPVAMAVGRSLLEVGYDRPS